MEQAVITTKDKLVTPKKFSCFLLLHCYLPLVVCFWTKIHIKK